MIRAMPVAMGAAMGAMIPLMFHGPLAAEGLGFVLVHLLSAAVVLTAAALWPPLRTGIRRHARMVPRMALGLPIGFVAICLHCVVSGHLA